MNRTIKFRGKRIDNGEWVYGDLLQPTEICDIYEISDCESIDGTRYEVISETIGQFTGLYDNTKKEIYENDIVRITGSKEIDIGKVIYEYNGFTVDVMNMDRSYGRDYLLEIFTEVIGNIYDNPELLEGE